MSVASFGEDAPARTGRALFNVENSSVQNTIYGGENAHETQGAITHGGRARVAGHNNERSFSPFATEATEPRHASFDNSPRLNKNKNSKFDVGCAKVGAGGFDAQRSRYDYESQQAAAAQMKARQLGGAGSFLSHD